VRKNSNQNQGNSDTLQIHVWKRIKYSRAAVQTFNISHFITLLGILCCLHPHVPYDGSCIVTFEGREPVMSLSYNVRIIHETLKTEGKNFGGRIVMKPHSSCSMQMRGIPLKYIAL
jgi:hypothetical protein